MRHIDLVHPSLTTTEEVLPSTRSALLREGRGLGRPPPARAGPRSARTWGSRSCTSTPRCSPPARSSRASAAPRRDGPRSTAVSRHRERAALTPAGLRRRRRACARRGRDAPPQRLRLRRRALQRAARRAPRRAARRALRRAPRRPPQSTALIQGLRAATGRRGRARAPRSTRQGPAAGAVPPRVRAARRSSGACSRRRAACAAATRRSWSRSGRAARARADKVWTPGLIVAEPRSSPVETLRVLLRHGAQDPCGRVPPPAATCSSATGRSYALYVSAANHETSVDQRRARRVRGDAASSSPIGSTSSATCRIWLVQHYLESTDLLRGVLRGRRPREQHVGRRRRWSAARSSITNLDRALAAATSVHMENVIDIRRCDAAADRPAAGAARQAIDAAAAARDGDALIERWRPASWQRA